MLHVFAALNYFIEQAQKSLAAEKKVKWYINNNNQVLPGSFQTGHHLNDLYSYC